MTNILTVQKEQPKIMSFSPIDPNNLRTSTSEFRGNKDNFVRGYKVVAHIAGWCIVVNKRIFELIGLLDETFDFYFADNDYAMTLRKHNLDHALVLTSEVLHIGEFSSSSIKKEGIIINENVKANKNVPKWLLSKPKMLEGYLKFDKKWGSRNSIRVKNRLFEIFRFLKQDKLIRLLYLYPRINLLTKNKYPQTGVYQS